MASGAAQITPRRFALQYSPPLLVLEYVDGRSGRLKHLRVHVAKALATKTTDDIVDGLRRQFPEFLAHAAVARSKLALLVDRLRIESSVSAPADRRRLGDGEGLLAKDLNAVSEEENKKAKAIMSVGFERNRLKPGDPGFEYDVRKEFAQPTEECDWDEEGEEEDSDEDEE